MLQLMDGFPDGVVAMEASGEVTTEDYDSIAMPAVERARAAGGKVRLLYVLGEDFTGYSAGAMWDDTKLGLSHPLSWERIAVVTDKEHLASMVHGLGWLMPGDVKVFALAELEDAKGWVTG